MYIKGVEREREYLKNNLKKSCLLEEKVIYLSIKKINKKNMKKLGKKELEIVINEISNEVCKIKKEKLVKEFEGSEKGKKMRELESSIKSMLEEVNKNVEELRKLEEGYCKEFLNGKGYGKLDLRVGNEFGYGKLGVEVRIGEGYKNGFSFFGSDVRREVERELILEGLRGEFDLDEVMKKMIEKFS